jgi:hypothetical protein
MGTGPCALSTVAACSEVDYLTFDVTPCPLAVIGDPYGIPTWCYDGKLQYTLYFVDVNSVGQPIRFALVPGVQYTMSARALYGGYIREMGGGCEGFRRCSDSESTNTVLYPPTTPVFPITWGAVKAMYR